MNSNVKKIVRCLINTQIASDGGKGIYELPRSEREWAIAHDGYSVKDWYLRRAIGLINSTRNCGIYYHIAYCSELSNWNDCYIVYFNIKLNGKRYQVSFHSYAGYYWENLANGTCNTRWSRKNSSRNVLKELRELIEA